MKRLDILASNKSMNLLLLSLFLQIALFVLPVFPTIPDVLRARVTFTGIFLYLVILTFFLLRINTSKSSKLRSWRRHAASLAVLLFAYLLYYTVMFGAVFSDKWEFLSQETANFMSTWIITMLIGYSYLAIYRRNEKEKEVERLKLENLQSRCEALANQINPHFFFNLLNGLASLIRGNKKESSLEYIDEMSDVFRYIMQINKETLITLEEELNFLGSYGYLLEIRYKDKLVIDYDIDPAMMNYKIPTLSLLPIIENVVKHNIIDSDHKIVVTIKIVDGDFLLISNPMFDKLRPAESNKIGLTNLSTRFKLLMDKDILIEVRDRCFNVMLPLVNSSRI